MLIRFIVKNLYSFKEETEFNLLPGRAKRMEYHKYNRNGIEVLKQTAIYGANGSGKSNLVKAIGYLRTMVLDGEIPYSFNSQKFKLAGANSLKPVELGIEFFCNDKCYFYSVTVNNGIIEEEYFGETGIGTDRSIFLRKSTTDDTKIDFFEGYESQPENRTLKNVIEKSLIKPYQPLFFLLNEINSDAFINVKRAYTWFEKNLIVITPETRSIKIAHLVDTDNNFHQFTNELMASFKTGISRIDTEAKPLVELLGKENKKQIDEVTNALMNSPEKSWEWHNSSTGETIVFVYQDGGIFSKKLRFFHKNEENEDVFFTDNEESDGTKRLLEFIPAMYDLINKDCTFIIDEMERSLHPTIIKELIAKFSSDETTKGQLIFTTHESNLLDQDIFRPDEIWFAEKSQNGATKLYSLSDFKEHSTIDIRKGYLTGRYGAIPFLGNLHDLNWHNKD